MQCLATPAAIFIENGSQAAEAAWRGKKRALVVDAKGMWRRAAAQVHVDGAGTRRRCCRRVYRLAGCWSVGFFFLSFVLSPLRAYAMCQIGPALPWSLSFPISALLLGLAARK